MQKTAVIARLLKNIVVFGVLFLIISLVVDWYRKPNAPAQFAEQVFYDIAEQPKIIAQLSHNKPMLLYFWGSWCSFCDYTSPAIQQLAEQDTPVLSVALKSGSNAEVKQYLSQNGYDFSTLNDPMGTFSKGWEIQATPTILIVKDGKIHNHTTGLTSYWGLKARIWLAQTF